MQPCNKILERAKADNVKFETQVVEQSSYSTYVNNQLILLKKEIQNKNPPNDKQKTLFEVVSEENGENPDTQKSNL